MARTYFFDFHVLAPDWIAKAVGVVGRKECLQTLAIEGIGEVVTAPSRAPWPSGFSLATFSGTVDDYRDHRVMNQQLLFRMEVALAYLRAMRLWRNHLCAVVTVAWAAQDAAVSLQALRPTDLAIHHTGVTMDNPEVLEGVLEQPWAELDATDSWPTVGARVLPSLLRPPCVRDLLKPLWAVDTAERLAQGWSERSPRPGGRL